jgi:folate-dependent phosphoribosylglycinamide formyltransferase PurN
MLGGQGESTSIVYHYLSSRLDIGLVMIEDAVDRKTFIKRRIRKLGFWTVIGQILFSVIVKPALSMVSQKRKREIVAAASLQTSDELYSWKQCILVSSVNGEDAIRYLQSYAPDIVIVNGTRIISEKVLLCCDAKFINMHAGITPAYRGVHGAYWALHNNDLANCGVTVHFVDKGIDSGDIIYQARISPTRKDNFITYPFLQVVAGLPLELQAIRDIENGTVRVISNDLSSKLYSHPTIGQYIYGLLFRKVK